MVSLFPHFQTCFSFPYYFTLTHPLFSVGPLAFSVLLCYRIEVQIRLTNDYLLELKLIFKLPSLFTHQLTLEMLTVCTHIYIFPIFSTEIAFIFYISTNISSSFILYSLNDSVTAFMAYLPDISASFISYSSTTFSDYIQTHNSTAYRTSF